MESASVHQSNTPQVIPLPKSVALPDTVKRVDIITLGRARLIVPHGEGWDSWFDDQNFIDNWVEERDQPADQMREPL